MPPSQGIGTPMRAGIEWLRDRWGWIVTVASFVLYFITIGVLYCYGLIFISLQEEFKSSATITGWIGSLAWACSTLTSPLTAVLLRCCQTRIIALLGIILCSSSLLISSYVSNVVYLFATFSIMYGMGINFAQHSTLCLIYTYFPKRNSTRTISFALTGCQVGLLALNPLMAYFVATKGWRLALRIFSGIVFLPGVISCIILLPPKKKNDMSGNPQTGERLALYQVCEHNGAGDANTNSDKNQNDVTSPSGAGKKVDSPLIVQSDGKGDMKPQVQGSKPTRTVTMCRFCLKNGEEEDGKEEIEAEESCDMERTAVDMKMSTNPVTYFFGIALATLSLAWTFFNVNLVSYTDSVGITANHGSILLTILAGAEMVGKALLCIFGDHVPFAKVYIIVMCNILSALISCGMIFCRDFYSMISIAIGIGLMRAIFNTVPFGAGIEIFGTSRTSEASTLAMFSYGSGYLVGSVIPGGIYDLTGSYTLSLVCMSCVFILSTIMFLVIPLRKRIYSYLLKTCLILQGPSKKEMRQTAQMKNKDACQNCGSIINIDYL